MSNVRTSNTVEQIERYNCLDSWIIRITLGLLVLIGVVTLISAFVYIDARNDRSQPIRLRHYPGLQLISEEKISDTQRTQRYEGVFAGMSPSLVADIEAFYLEQMDSCIRLSEQTEPTPEQFHTIVCQKDRSHELLGFTQFTRVEIKPIRDENGILTGEVVVITNDQWQG
ncbi:MAG: hypothetical protein CUN55_04045 [Phototrophicales bacterium]|nr:MAG: hypothetical protein CUN55_04045 [Phototrophicales bacterium]